MSHLPTSSFHLPVHFIRHINESESVEHSINISHASDIAQSFRPVHHCSHLFYIVQCQQYRTPCQALTILPAVDPKLFCVLSMYSIFFFSAIGLLPPNTPLSTHLTLEWFLQFFSTVNKPTADHSMAIHRRLDSFSLFFYLLLILWVKTELRQNLPHITFGFQLLRFLSANKHFCWTSRAVKTL